MNTEQYIQDEVERQKSVLFDEFRDALNFAKAHPNWNAKSSIEAFVMVLAEKIEPEVNRFVYETRTSNLRRSEVGFLHGGKATKAGEVQHQFDRWYSNLWVEGILRGGSIQSRISGDESLCDLYIKQLLQIHPWVDGNGRVASILRNWMLNTLDDPSPLPYYSF